MHGASTSGVEVTHVSPHGFWLLLKDEELSVPFSEFPWFKNVTMSNFPKWSCQARTIFIGLN